MSSAQFCTMWLTTVLHGVSPFVYCVLVWINETICIRKYDRDAVSRNRIRVQSWRIPSASQIFADSKFRRIQSRATTWTFALLVFAPPVVIYVLRCLKWSQALQKKLLLTHKTFQIFLFYLALNTNYTFSKWTCFSRAELRTYARV